MNCVIRVDSATQIGTGHVMRCLTLVQRLGAPKHSILFVCKAHQGHIAALIEQQGYRVALLACQENDATATLAHAAWLAGSQQDDAKQTQKAITQHFSQPIDWIIVDHYALDKTWERHFQHTRLCVIDDLGDRIHQADLLLDQNLDATPEKYRNQLNPECKMLLGLKYALLRDEFYLPEQSIKERRHATNIERILVMFGGTDPDNLTQQVTEQLLQIPQVKAIDVIVSRNTHHIVELKAQYHNHPQVQLHISPTQISALMLQADLAVGAGGSSSWERCMVGLPTISLCQAENQKQAMAAMQAHGIISVLATEQLDQLGEHIHYWCQANHYKDSVTACLELSTRIPFAYDEYFKRKRPLIKLEAATQADCLDILSWRNDSQSRHNSVNSAMIAPDTHQKWFKQVLHNKAISLLIAKKDNHKIGMVRFNQNALEQAEVSINLAPQYRGQGLSVTILKSALIQYHKQHPHITLIQAKIEQHNQSSLALFKACFFQYKAAEANFQLFELERDAAATLFKPSLEYEHHAN